MGIKKLKLILNHQILSLFLSVSIFAFLLEIINITRYFTVIVVFILYSWYLYRKFFSGQVKFPFLFLFFVLTSLLFGIHLSAFGFEWLVFILLSALLYLIIGSVRVMFHNYKQIFGSIYYVIIFLISAYLSSGILSYGVLALLAGFLVYYLTLMEYASFMIGEKNKRTSTWSLIIAFIASELLWVSSLLSVGALGVAIIVLVFWISSVDVFLQFFLGRLSKIAIYRDIVFAVVSFFIAMLFVLFI